MWYIFIYITSQKKTPTREGEGFYASLVRTTGVDYWMNLAEWYSGGKYAYESWFGQIPRISALRSWSIRGTYARVYFGVISQLLFSCSHPDRLCGGWVRGLRRVSYISPYHLHSQGYRGFMPLKPSTYKYIIVDTLWVTNFLNHLSTA
jgi:hypothetical protein